MAGKDSVILTIPDQVGGRPVDVEEIRTDSGLVERQRVSVAGDLMSELVEAVEALVLEQRLTNLLLKEAFRLDYSVSDVLKLRKY